MNVKKKKVLGWIAQVLGVILFIVAIFSLFAGNWYYGSALDSALDGPVDTWNSVCSQVNCTEFGALGHSVSSFSSMELAYAFSWPVYLVCCLILLCVSVALVLQGVSFRSEA